MKIYITLLSLTIFLAASDPGLSQSKHSKTSAFKSYHGLVMAGYQGWFRAHGDGSNSGWQHYQANGKLDKDNIHIDVWPDVSEYQKTYNTGFNLNNGKLLG
jgi:hypothetical protein